MPEGPETLAAQVRDLAARIGALEQGRDRSAERPAILGRARNPRLAITCKKDTGTDYPDISDEPNTYYVKFLDSTYTETEGKQTATHTERQAEGRFLAHVPNGTLFLPRDTIVETFHDNGRWWVSPPVNGDIYFELKDALAPGGYADAYPLTYSGGYAVDTGQYFRVHDAFNRFRGRARVASPALQGSRGKCRWNTLSKRFEIDWLQPHVTIMQPLDTALFMSTDGAAPTSANNNAGGELDNNAVVILGWNDANEDWDTLVGPCPA